LDARSLRRSRRAPRARLAALRRADRAAARAQRDAGAARDPSRALERGHRERRASSEIERQRRAAGAALALRGGLRAMSPTTSRSTNVREGRQVRIAISASGDFPRGSACSVRIFKGPRGQGGALIDRLSTTLQGAPQVAVWEARGLDPDEAFSP